MRACVNLDGKGDPYPWAAPVTSMSCGRSPYGIFHMAGNLQEWISRDGQLDRANPLHILRGGATDATPASDVATTIFRNPRPPRTANYSNGFRCVIEDPEELP